VSRKKSTSIKVEAKKADGLNGVSSPEGLSLMMGTQISMKDSFLSVTYSHSKHVVLKTVTPSKLSDIKSFLTPDVGSGMGPPSSGMTVGDC